MCGMCHWSHFQCALLTPEEVSIIDHSVSFIRVSCNDDMLYNDPDKDTCSNDDQQLHNGHLVIYKDNTQDAEPKLSKTDRWNGESECIREETITVHINPYW